jgi:hypothetical protein
MHHLQLLRQVSPLKKGTIRSHRLKGQILIFKVLPKELNEVPTHARFIGELLSQ